MDPQNQTGFVPSDDLRAMEQLFSNNRRPVEIPAGIEIAAIEVIPPAFNPNSSFLVIGEDQAANVTTTLVYEPPPQRHPEEATTETETDLTRVPIGWLISLIKPTDTDPNPDPIVRDPVRQEILVITPGTDDTSTPVVTPLTLDFGRPTHEWQLPVVEEDPTAETEPESETEPTEETLVETQTDPARPILTQIAGVTSAVADPHRLMESPVHLAIVGNPRPVTAVHLQDADTGEVAATFKHEEMWRINFLNENGDAVGGNISGALDRPLEKPIESYVAAILDSEGNVLDTAPVSASQGGAETSDPSSSGTLETLRNEFDAQGVRGGVEVTVHPMEESRIVAAIQGRFPMSEDDARELARSAESIVELRDAEENVLQSQRFITTLGAGPLRWPAEPGSRVEVVTETYFRQAEALAVARQLREEQTARVRRMAGELQGPLNAAINARVAVLEDWIRGQGPRAGR